jgi:hypothetical protein
MHIDLCSRYICYIFYIPRHQDIGVNGIIDKTANLDYILDIFSGSDDLIELITFVLCKASLGTRLDYPQHIN